MKNWIRVLRIELSSSKLNEKIVIDGDDSNSPALNIRVNGTKYLSLLQDSFKVEIDNLPYQTIVDLIGNKFYDIKILAGYKSSSVNTIFKGGVLYISDRKNDDRSHTCVILCGNNVVAKYGQQKMNLTLNSGLNAWTLVKVLSEDAGIKNCYIDESLKGIYLNEQTRNSTTIGQFLESFSKSMGYITSGDESTSQNELSIVNPVKTSLRKYKINREQVLITKGFPTITSDGLTFTTLCSFNYSPCDVIQFDNELLDLSIDNSSDVFKEKTRFIDKNGEYIIIKADYSLENRGQSFDVEIKAKSKTIYSSILGGFNE